METANPFVAVAQNGADAMFRGGVANGVDDDDFGPETDVDMVDDVLMSPTIAAAKALVAGCHEVDDLEQQRQQLADFDDPSDMDPNRDTPTPPAHEVASNAVVDPIAESGGEESEEEWNYIPGKDTKSETHIQDQEDMSSQLNPNAAEFVPVSPTRLLMMDDAIISASPRLGFETSLDEVQVPSEKDFDEEISHRPGDLGIKNGLKSKHGDKYFMRDNFSTIHNNSSDFNSTSTCAQLGDDSIVSLSPTVDNSTACASEDKENIFDSDNSFSSNAFGVNDIFAKNDPMTSSVIKPEDFGSSPEPEDNVIPGTPKSTVVEAPASPVNLDVSHHLEEDHLTSEDLLAQEVKLPSDFESENREGGSDIVQETDDGFITEHRRSPPIDLSFKPIQTFSDTNPFGTLQTPSSTTPLDAFETIVKTGFEQNESSTETPKKSEVSKQEDSLSFLANTPSFISARQKTPIEEKIVPFDELESPTEIPQFELPPNANSSLLASDLPKSPVPQSEEVPSNDPLDTEIESYQSKDHNSQDFSMEMVSPKYEETSFTTDVDLNKETTISHVDLDTTAGFLIEESKLMNGEEHFDEVEKSVSKDEIASSAISQELLLDSIVDIHPPEVKTEQYLETKDTDFESETKEMNLEFESHIVSHNARSDSPHNVDDFEVISRDELKMEDSSITNEHVDKEIDVNPYQEPLNLSESPVPHENEVLSTNPFMDGLMKTKESVNAINENIENDHKISSDEDMLTSPHEPQVLKTESYQLLTPADEPICTKTKSFLTEDEKPHEDEVKSDLGDTQAVETENASQIKSEPEELFSQKPEEVATVLENVSIGETIRDHSSTAKEESLLPKSEPVQSQVVTETLITALEETSQVPTSATADTPPPTPAAEVDNKDDSERALLAAAAAGAVVAGATLAVDKMKKETTASSKKPLPTTTKKPGETKAPIKATSAKAPAARPASAKTSTTAAKPANATTKPAGLTTKPTGPTAKPSTTVGAKPATTVGSKPTAAKTAAPSAAAKKPLTSAKPGPPKPAATSSLKPATSTTAAAPKAVPKHLPVNKTTTTMKSTSKPTTPTSKPTTPTAPKSPSVMKTEVKSPPRPAVKSTLTTSRPSTAAKSPVEDSDKKTMTNGEVKPGIKKVTEGPVKKATPTTTSKPLAPRPSSAPASKTTAASKAPTAPGSKPLSKTTSTVPPKTKPASGPTVPPPIKRPTTGTAAKPAEKTGKDSVNKQISSTKTAVNGKVPPKTANGTKKTDAKVNGKPNDKLKPSIKLDEIKAENEIPSKVQEDNITTTNGFGEHNDHIIEENGIRKNEVLSPVILDNVN